MPTARATCLPEPSAPSGGPPGRTAILITRPEPGATETASRVAALGLTPVLCPALVIQPVGATLPPALQIAAVLVTSSNAIPALPEAYRQNLLLAVGNATADRARQAGFTQVSSADGDADALAALVQRRVDRRSGPLLLAAGRHNGTRLAAELRGAGYRVLRRVVYAAEPAPALTPPAAAALRAGTIRTALFFSTRTARHFVRLIRDAGLITTVRPVDAVAISRSAGVALEALPWQRVHVAARPNQDEMLALLR